MRVLIVGANGFIGNALAKRILAQEDWSVTGFDLHDHRLRDLLHHPRFAFHRGDLRSEPDRIDALIAASDVVLPLAAVATPANYVRDPLGTFELDFAETLRIVRRTADLGRRLIFPSTSEVYGMCDDAAFDEDASRLVLGPIRNQRWIYACSKQLLDRIIWALGEQGLRFTIFRPFNWFGPDQDDIDSDAPGSSRVITQFLGHMLRGEPIELVDGGRQRRSFTYIDDGVDALMTILRNADGAADGGIFNLGNPDNLLSIRELALLMLEELSAIPGYHAVGGRATIRDTSGAAYYGEGYEDVPHRKPGMAAVARLGWRPRIGVREGLRRVIVHHAALDAGRPAAAVG